MRPSLALPLAAGGLTCAGIWLPLPTRSATPSRTAVYSALVAWIVSIAAWLTCIVIYSRQYIHAYYITVAKAALPDRVTPITLTAVVAVFVIIFLRNSPVAGTRLASAAIGALAAPLISSSRLTSS